MTGPVIELAGITFSYGGVSAVQDVNLTVEAGEFLGIVGPNAGGKSTLLKIILGLLEPQTGRIQILNRSPTGARKRIGYVPQYPSFPRDFPITVAETVLLGRLGASPMLGGYRRADRVAANLAMAKVEIDTLAARRIDTLSGGQLQRVLLARALVGEPKILILDEPTANIDQRLESDIFDLLKSLNRQLTILVVSHDVAFISGYVGRVACLNRTLVCHRTASIDGQTIQSLYGENVRMVAHHH